METGQLQLHCGLAWRVPGMGWHALVDRLALNALLPSALCAQAAPRPAALAQETGAGLSPAFQHRTAILMAFIFAATWFVSTAMAAHLPALLQSTGAWQWP